METTEDLAERTPASEQAPAGVRIQSAAFFLELSLDWIVLRASENVHQLLGESHVTLIDEPLGRFVHSQALHDLRNLFARLSGTTGIGRAYAVRLTNDPELFDIAFQLSDGRVLLEATPSTGAYGEAFGTVGGLVAGLANSHGQALLDGGARRMRALTGFDRVTLVCGDHRAESSRGAFPAPANMTADLPTIVADAQAAAVPIFPRVDDDAAAADALLRAPGTEILTPMASMGIRSSMRVTFEVDNLRGEFRCGSRTPRPVSFELHAAAELFAQLFAMRLEIDHLRNGG